MATLGSSWILWPLLIATFFLVVAGKSQLKQVQLLFRHGDTAPTATYPTDQWKYAWPDGLGQLTTLGMLQQYQTGEYLRQRYGNFIKNTYNHYTVHVQSTDVDRSLMSAYANLAGFLPPTGRQVWNSNLTWQPIPVHTLPPKEDYVLSLDVECKEYDRLHAEQMSSPEVEKINVENRELYKFLSKQTGLAINNFINASSLYEILSIQQTHNLTRPPWVDDDLMEALSSLHVHKLSSLVKTHEMRRLIGGPLLSEMINNMKNNIYNTHTDEHKIYMYSAYDVTVVSLLSALGVFEPHAPPYCSMVMVELLLENRTEFCTATTRDPYELTLKGCTSPCPFEEFRRLTASIIPEDIKAECVAHITFLQQIKIIILITVCCAVMILLRKCDKRFPTNKVDNIPEDIEAKCSIQKHNKKGFDQPDPQNRPASKTSCAFALVVFLLMIGYAFYKDRTSMTDQH